MEDVLELKEMQRAEVSVNPKLEKYEKRVGLSKKAKEASEFLEKHPIPAWILLRRYSTTQQEKGICIRGILKNADVETSILVVTVAVNDYASTNYNIRTVPETWNNIVKAYWGESINVLIRPQINADNQLEYELIEVEINEYPSVYLLKKP